MDNSYLENRTLIYTLQGLRLISVTSADWNVSYGIMLKTDMPVETHSIS